MRALSANLERAERLVTRGEIAKAARVLHEERARAQIKLDPDRSAQIDQTITRIRGALDQERLALFDTVLVYGRRTDEDVDLSMLGVALAAVGAATMIVGIFLPLWDAASVEFATLVENSVVQSGPGLFFVGLALAAGAAMFRAHKRARKTWAPVLAGAIAIAAAVITGSAAEYMEVCSVEPQAIEGNCQRASPGLGVYALGVGGLLMLVGGWHIRTSRRQAGAARAATSRGPQDAATKTCPDCAESVLAAARVCKHCGFRFEGDQAEVAR